MGKKMRRRCARWIISVAVCGGAFWLRYNGSLGDWSFFATVVFAVSTALGLEIQEITKSGVDFNGVNDE